MSDELLTATLDPANWKPNIQLIMDKTGKPRTTVKDFVQKRIDDCKIELHVVENTESEALAKKAIKGEMEKLQTFKASLKKNKVA